MKKIIFISAITLILSWCGSIENNKGVDTTVSWNNIVSELNTWIKETTSWNISDESNRKTYTDTKLWYIIKYPSSLKIKASNEYDQRLDKETHSISLQWEYYNICIWETCGPSGTDWNGERKATVSFLWNSTVFQGPIRSVTGYWSGNFDDFICDNTICISPSKKIDSYVNFGWKWLERSIEKNWITKYNEYVAWYQNYLNKWWEITDIVKNIQKI